MYLVVYVSIVYSGIFIKSHSFFVFCFVLGVDPFQNTWLIYWKTAVRSMEIETPFY